MIPRTLLWKAVRLGATTPSPIPSFDLSTGRCLDCPHPLTTCFDATSPRRSASQFIIQSLIIMGPGIVIPYRLATFHDF